MTIMTIQQAPDGEQYIQIPDEILNELGWNEYTILDIDIVDGNIYLSRKNSWSVEELEQGDTFEKVMDDVIHNHEIHYIEHDGKSFVIRPYDEQDISG